MNAQPSNFDLAPVEAVSQGVNQFVTFSAGDNAYGIDIMSVREIRSWSPTTPLPGRPFGAKGVLDIRGSVVEVYDLSAILGGPSIEARAGHVVLVVALNRTNVGILVDTVSDIIFAEPGDFRDPPAAGHGAKGRRGLLPRRHASFSDPEIGFGPARLTAQAPVERI